MPRKPLGVKPEPETIHCANCGRRLSPRYEIDWRRRELFDDDDQPIGGGYEAWYSGKILGYGVDGVFCTGGCAERFGRRCVWAGVRLDSYNRQVIDARRRSRERKNVG